MIILGVDWIPFMFSENTLLLLRILAQGLGLEVKEGLVDIKFIKRGWLWSECIGSVSMFEKGDKCNEGFVYSFYGYPATNDAIVKFLRKGDYKIIINNKSDFPVKY